MLQPIIRLSIAVILCCAALIWLADALGSTLHSPLLAFISERDNNREVYAADVHRNLLINISQHPASDTAPAWSSDGTMLRFQSSRSGAVRFYVYDLPSGRLWDFDTSPPSVQLKWQLNENKVRPAYIAPNRAATAYEYGGVTAREIVIQQGCAPLINISNHGADDYHPVWSPDGTKIAFNSRRDAGDAEIYVATLDQTLLSDNNLRECASAIPIEFVSGFTPALNSSEALDAAIQVNSTAPVNVTQQRGFDEAPVWSADSSMLAFISHRRGDMEVYVVDLTSGRQWNISRHKHRDYTPVWSP